MRRAGRGQERRRGRRGRRQRRAGERAAHGEGGGAAGGPCQRDTWVSTLSDRDGHCKRLRRGTAWPTYTVTDHAALHAGRGLRWGGRCAASGERDRDLDRPAAALGARGAQIRACSGDTDEGIYRWAGRGRGRGRRRGPATGFGPRACVGCDGVSSRAGNVDITFKSDSKHVRMGLRGLGTRASCRYIRSPK